MGIMKVIKPGFLSTVQDRGRFGFRHFGVPVSGAMDSEAYLLANRILGNFENNPAIELTLKGGEYKFEGAGIIALTGADMNALLNDESVQTYQQISVSSGDVLKLGFAAKGCRAYLGIKGMLKIDKVLGSCSTFLTGKFGGKEGRSLQVGDVIEWTESKEQTEPFSIKEEQKPYYSSKIIVHLKPGPEFELLDDFSVSKLESRSFMVDSSSNRMAIKLKPEEKLMAKKSEITSSFVFPGIVQLPASGNPIILMKDAQTVGGYPRIGIIEEPDLSRLAQLQPNSTVRFKIIKTE